MGPYGPMIVGDGAKSKGTTTLWHLLENIRPPTWRAGRPRFPRGRQEDMRYWGAGPNDCHIDGGNERCGGLCQETDSRASEGLPRKTGGIGGPTTGHGAPVGQTSRCIHFIISTTRDLPPRVGPILPATCPRCYLHGFILCMQG